MAKQHNQLADRLDNSERGELKTRIERINTSRESVLADLAAIHEKRLYREYGSFKQFIDAEFKKTVSWAYKQLTAVAAIASPSEDQNVKIGNKRTTMGRKCGINSTRTLGGEDVTNEVVSEPIAEILAAVNSGKIKATDTQLEALAGFEEERQEAMLESFLAGRQTVANAIETGCAADPTMEEEIKKQASEIECACRAILKFATEQIEKLTDPWMDDLNRRTGAIQKIKDCCETLRSCKCVAACPKCEGEGCTKCYKTGRITKYVQQQLS